MESDRLKLTEAQQRIARMRELLKRAHKLVKPYEGDWEQLAQDIDAELKSQKQEDRV